MLIGGDDISNDVNTLNTCCHVFFNVCLHSRSFPLRADWWKYDSTVDRDSRYVVASSPSFSYPVARAPGELARRLGRLVFIGQIFQQVAISSGTVV